MRDDNWNDHDDNNDYSLKLEDLPAEEVRSLAATLVDIVLRITHRIPHFKITPLPPVEDEDDECEFDLRLTYIPQEDLPAPGHAPRMRFKQNRVKARRTRIIFFSAFMIVMLAVLANAIGPVHDRIANLVSNYADTQQGQNPLSPYPGHLLDNPTNVVVEESKTTILKVTIAGQEKYVYEAAPVPFECPTSVIPGQQRQVGNFPIWLSSFGAPNTVLHLPPGYVSSMKDWQGWVVNFQVNVKLRYTNLILLSINDVNHNSSPLLRDPSNGSHSWRVIINPGQSQYTQGATRQHYIGTWNMSLYLPGAGCYALNAAWDEGNWEVVFAAGR